MIAARPFPRAALRYRVVGTAFVLSLAVGPLAFWAASLRPAAAPGGAALPAAGFALVAAPLLAAAAIVSGVLILVLGADVVRLRRVKQYAAPLGRLAVRRARLGISPTVATPTAIGYLHPAVVVPAGFRECVDADEWDAVVAHECAHLARLDDWAKALQSAALRLCWWLPGLWILGRALDLERELASDEHAACESGSRRYAACLLRLATDRASEALAPAFGARRSHIAIRVERLLRPAVDGGPVRRAAALGAFTAAAFSIVVAAVLALPGTGPRPLATSAARPAAPLAARPPAAKRAAPRLAERIRRTPSAQRPVKLAQAPAPRLAAPSAKPRPVVRREPSRPAAPPAALPGPVETVAVVVPRRRCATCFGPLRAPEEVGSSTAAPPAEAVSSVAAVAADDASAGPVSLGGQLIWFRFPARVIQAPPAP